MTQIPPSIIAADDAGDHSMNVAESSASTKPPDPAHTQDGPDVVVVPLDWTKRLIAEYGVLYGLIEGVRAYIGERDISPGAEAICIGLTQQSTRVLEYLKSLTSEGPAVELLDRI